MQRPLLALALGLTACDDGMVPVDVSGDGGSAVEAWEAADGRRREAFDFGADARTPVADYLFVLDGSVSMNHVIDRVREGFASLDPAMFPSEARIAVMSATPGRERELQPARGPLQYELDPAVGSRRLAKHDPGFLGLVDGRGIASLVQREPALASSYAHAGCSGWFAPGDTNVDGVPCIVAHTQSLLVATRAEAGLTAFGQLLERHPEGGVFRPGAAVNVVFVSDTHDPGLVGPRGHALLAERPTAADLIARIDATHAVASVRFHAIAPATECVEPWAPLGPAYYDAADATGGAKLDLCTETDYRPILERAMDEGARPVRPRFVLGAEPARVDGVRVDGAPVGYDVVGPRVVEVTGLVPSGTQRVEVDFHRAPVAMDRDRRSIERPRRAQRVPGNSAAPSAERRN